MSRKSITLTFVLIIFGVFGFSIIIPKVQASGTIYIRPDGSIDPPTANITSLDNVTYTLSGDVNDSIFIYRSDIVLDGSGYTIHGDGSNEGITNYHGGGLDNVTIRNVNIDNVYRGIFFEESSNVRIVGNNVTNVANIGVHILSSSTNIVSGNYFENISLGNPPNGAGIHIDWFSNHNNITGNAIMNSEQGIYVSGWCHGNVLTQNNITGCYRGIQLHNDASYGSITGNRITETTYGIDTGGYNPCLNNSIHENVLMDNEYGLYFPSFMDNTLCHNYFLNNTYHAFDPYNASANVWDCMGEGNYWDDYLIKYPNATERDGLGIWDTSYVVDDNNQDNYPIVPEFPSILKLPLFMIIALLTVGCMKKTKIKRTDYP